MFYEIQTIRNGIFSPYTGALLLKIAIIENCRGRGVLNIYSYRFRFVGQRQSTERRVVEWMLDDVFFPVLFFFWRNDARGPG